MKRSTGLQRRTRLQSHSTLTRTPMNRTRKSKAAKAREFSPAIRQAVYDRCSMVCEFCNRRPLAHIHHAKLRSQLSRAEGSGGIANALGVCIVCHQAIHGSQELQALALRKAHRLAGINVDDNTDNLVSMAEFIG